MYQTNTPPVTKHLLIINIVCYLATAVAERTGVDLNALFGLHFFKAPSFGLYQLVTYMFMHGGFTHLLFNMFTLWMFGRTIEYVLGSRRFLWFYMLCGVGAGLFQEIAQLVSYYAQGLDGYTAVNASGHMMPMSYYLDMWTTVGASGAIYGLLGAFAMLFPNERIMLLFPPIPLKAKYMVVVFVAIDLFLAMGGNGDGVAHAAHLGGAAVGALLIWRWRKRQTSRQTGFTSWEEYDPQRKSLWERLKQRFAAKPKRPKTPHFRHTPPPPPRTAADDAEIQEIIRKLKASGYASLTREEKDKLFNMRR